MNYDMICKDLFMELSPYMKDREAERIVLKTLAPVAKAFDLLERSKTNIYQIWVSDRNDLLTSVK